MRRRCRWTGCPEIVDLGGSGYCRRHQAKGNAAKYKRNNAKKDKAFYAFYSMAAWQRVRRRVLDDRPVCERCRKVLATTVDHVVPRSVSREGELDTERLQALCHRCHAQKTAIDRRKYPDRPARSDPIDASDQPLSNFEL